MFLNLIRLSVFDHVDSEFLFIQKYRTIELWCYEDGVFFIHLDSYLSVHRLDSHTPSAFISIGWCKAGSLA